jgi:hypothetical protein
LDNHLPQVRKDRQDSRVWMRLWLDSRNLNLPTPYCMKPVSFSTDRRRFIRTAVGASIAPFILPSGLRAQTSANGKLTIGLIGNGKQGNILLKRFLGREDVVVIAVCDVDTNRREATKKVVEDYYGKNQNTAWKGCTAHNDFREVLDRKDIDHRGGRRAGGKRHPLRKTADADGA